MTLIEAIAHQEGFYVTGSRAQRNNNPGNIEWGEFAKEHGSIGLEPAELCDDKPRFAVFSSVEAGFKALGALLGTPSYRDLTVAQAIAKYAPSSENDTANYVRNVCVMCGVRPTDMVATSLEWNCSSDLHESH